MADAYEPGSIFKIFTAAAGLQEKVVDPDEVLDCGDGSIEVAGTRINDHHVFDQLSFRDVMAKSSDVGVDPRGPARWAARTSTATCATSASAAATGVDLPGESAGLLRPHAALERALARRRSRSARRSA